MQVVAGKLWGNVANVDNEFSTAVSLSETSTPQLKTLSRKISRTSSTLALSLYNRIVNTDPLAAPKNRPQSFL